MNILLIGEASGVHRNLAKGLRALGHEALHMTQSASTSWQWMDGSFSPDWPGLLGGIARNVMPFVRIAQLPHFDVANYVNTITTVHGLHTRYLDLPLIRRKVDVMSYYALGCDEIGLIRRNPMLPYAPCETCIASRDTLARDCDGALNPRFERSREQVQRTFDLGSACMLEYSHVADLFPGRFRPIPFPVDVDPIVFEPATSAPRTRIIHTPTRRGFKGTAVVLEAMAIVASLRDDFDFQVVEGLSYPDYLDAVRGCDIVIDQVHSQSPGMNGLEMLAAGKIVLSGATPLGNAFFPFMAHTPMFDASPDPAILAAGICGLLDRKAEFPALAQAGRDYVARNHDCVAVAKQFLDHWQTAQTDQQ